MRSWYLVLAVVFYCEPAHAYIGPGAGLGAMAVAVALIVGAALLLFGFIWYPLRRLLKKNSKGQADNLDKS